MKQKCFCMNVDQSYMRKDLMHKILSKLGLKFAHYSSIDTTSYNEMYGISFNDGYEYILLDRQNRHIICWSNSPDYLFAHSFKNEKSVINIILNETENFSLIDDPNAKIDNPCFGCKSLEEALIKIELNSNKNLEI